MSAGQIPPSPPPPPPPDAPPPYTPPPPGGGNGARLPWEDRNSLGFVPALVETVKLLAKAPSDAFSRLRPDGDYVSPILFGVILTWVGTFFSQIWSLLFGNAMQSLLPSGGQTPFAFGGGVGSMIIALIVMPFIYVIALFIGAGIFHLCLMLVGALNSSPLRFEGTLKVLAYSSISSLANIVPFIGGLIGAVIALILLVLGFEQVHRTERGKAAMAALIPVALCCLCGIIMAVVFGASLAAIFAGANAG